MTPAAAARKIIIDSRLEEIPRVTRWVEEQIGGAGLKDGLSFDIQVCLEEAIANIVLHAFKGAKGHPIVVSLAIGAEEVSVQVRDSGPPFDPRGVAQAAPSSSLQDATIGGVGIRLIRGLALSFDYVRLNDLNQLTLTFASRGRP